MRQRELQIDLGAGRDRLGGSVLAHHLTSPTFRDAKLDARMLDKLTLAEGPYQFPEKLIPLTILNALEGKPIPVYGDGRNIRDWLFVDDHCSGIEAVLQGGTPGEVYNIGGINEWYNIDIVHLICERLDELQPGEASYEEQITYVTDRPGHDRRYAIDAGRMQSELGWSPQHDFESGIEQTIRWYLANRDWCDRVRSGEYRDYYARQYGGSANP